MDLFDSEPRDGFRRNLLVVLSVHIVLIATLWFISRGARAAPEEQITWLDGSAFADSLTGAPPSAESPAPPPSEVLPALPPLEPELKTEPDPEPIQAPAVPPPPDPEPITPPKPTPPPAPTPKPQPRPQAERATPTPKPKITKTPPVPKPRTASAATAKPTTSKPKPTQPRSSAPSPTASADSRATSANASGSTSSPSGSGERAGAPNGSATATVIQTYYAAVGENFRGTWNVYKPLVGEGSGDRLSARVHVRISASGSVLEATLTQSTGNQVVDDSIRRSFADFKKVPAPPAALLKDGAFESDIAVILSI